MRIEPLLMFAVLLSIGCNKQTVSEYSSQDKSNVASVAFRSHLVSNSASDPIVKLAQWIRVVPDVNEITQNHDSIVIQLPSRTPYDGGDEQFYLRGFAIGKLSKANIQFI